MTLRFVPLRRIAGLSVAITLITAPVASAQAPAPASDIEGTAPANTALLSPAAFARLVQPPPAAVAAAPAIADPPRPSLIRHGTAAVARQAQSAPAKAPQQKSWASRHKVITGVIVGVSAFFAVFALCVERCWPE